MRQSTNKNFPQLMKEPTLLDQLRRPLRDLRISLTDRCNLRCGYCMPKEVYGDSYPFLAPQHLMSFEEIARLARLFVMLGVKKIRLTGGEPLMRSGVDDLVAMLAAIRGIEDLAMTSNGIMLGHYGERLALAGLNRVTVSLDAVDEEVFATMIRKAGFAQVKYRNLTMGVAALHSGWKV
jgi:cyclic pyranopterin phosphate synthase